MTTLLSWGVSGAIAVGVLAVALDGVRALMDSLQFHPVRGVSARSGFRAAVRRARKKARGDSW